MGLIFKNFFLAIPFYFLWNWLAPIYFYGLPDVYKELPFWNCVGLLLLLAIIRIAVVPSPVWNSKIHWKGPKKFKEFIDVN